MIHRVFPPQQALRPYLRNIMVGSFRCLANHLPASPDVQLVIYLHGAGHLTGQDAGQAIPPAFIAGPRCRPLLFCVEPNSRFVAATFRPGGLLACVGIPANLFADQMVPLEHCLGAEATVPLRERLGIARSDCAIVGLVETFLLQRLLQFRPNTSPLPLLSTDRLLAPVSTLADDLALSPRQLERRFLAHAGVPLRDFRRLARFSLVLGQLLHPAGRARGFAQLAQDGSYTDQAHFTRDFRQFIGEPPARFLKAQQQEGSIYDFWRFGPAELQLFT